MAQLVTLMMTSRPSSIFGSGTLSQRMSFLPCQHRAFMNEWVSNFDEVKVGHRGKACLPLNTKLT